MGTCFTCHTHQPEQYNKRQRKHTQCLRTEQGGSLCENQGATEGVRKAHFEAGSGVTDSLVRLHNKPAQPIRLRKNSSFWQRRRGAHLGIEWEMHRKAEVRKWEG